MIGAHPKIAATVSVVLLVLSLGLVARRVWRYPAPRPPQAYYLNLQNGELFAAVPALPPIIAADGGQAVRAYVFSCTGCDDPQARRTLYLEMYTEDAKAQFTASERDQNSAVIVQGHLVSAYVPGADPQWVPASSPQGVAIARAPWQQCANPVECKP